MFSVCTIMLVIKKKNIPVIEHTETEMWSFGEIVGTGCAGSCHFDYALCFHSKMIQRGKVATWLKPLTIHPDNLSEKLHMRRIPSVNDVMDTALRTYVYITVTSNWAQWRLDSPASPLVCSNVCPGADLRKHQSSASLAFARVIHRWPVNSRTKSQ